MLTPSLRIIATNAVRPGHYSIVRDASSAMALRRRVHTAHFVGCLGCRQFRRMALLAPSVRRTELGPRWLG